MVSDFREEVRYLTVSLNLLKHKIIIGIRKYLEAKESVAQLGRDKPFSPLDKLYEEV